MVDDVKVLYPEFKDITVNIQGNTQVNLFEALVVAGYAVTHQNGYFDIFNISFVNPNELTDKVIDKVQEFFYRECGQTQEISFDTFTDFTDNTQGISVYWVNKYTVDNDTEIDTDIQYDIDACFNRTKEFAHTFHKYCWNSTVHKVA